MTMHSYRSKAAWQCENNTSTQSHITEDPLAVIYNKDLWQLNKVSPLYDLQYHTVKLKQYSSKIQQALVTAVPADSYVEYVVLMEELVNLKYSEDDANSLIINVLSSTQENNSKSKMSYSAILLSWGVSSSLDNATHLPYLLERGQERIGTAVKATLQTIFDCNIKQFCFTQQQLLQFGFNFVDYSSSHSTDPFTLIYRTPQVDNKDEIKVSFEVGDINIIWNGIKKEVEKKSDLASAAYQMLVIQIGYMIMLDILMFDLCKVILPNAEVRSNGVVKMKTPEIVNCVFIVLNEISDIPSDKDMSAELSTSDTWAFS